MPPRTKFSRAQIVEAAFDIAKKEGTASLTIRRVADALGSSIAPIYVNFETVDDLIEAVLEEVVALSQRLIAQQQTGNPFRDIGMASLSLARDYPHLFRDLISVQKKQMQRHQAELSPELVQAMRQDPELEGLSDDQLSQLLLRMRVFQMGLSFMIANDLLPEAESEEAQIALLLDTGADLISGMKQGGEQGNV